MNGETLAFAYGAIGRWVTYLSVVTIGGAAGFALFVQPTWRPAAGDRAPSAEVRVLRVAVVAALTLLAAALWRLYAQTYSIFGLDESVSWSHIRIVAFDTNWGGTWMWQLGAAVLATGLLAIASANDKARRLLVCVSALATVLTVSLTGHAQTVGAAWLNIGLQMLHVAGVSLWIGTLFVVITMLRSGDEDAFVAAVRAFSPLAIGAVSLLAVSGLVTAVVYLDSLSALWRDVYGRVLVLKVVLFGAVAALGAYHWRRLKPVLHEPDQSRRLKISGSVELLLAALVLAVTAILVALPLTHA